MLTNELLKIIESGSKECRSWLTEASHSFVPGSAAYAIYRFYLAAREYYSYMLGYSFQLYSDCPKYLLTLTGVHVDYLDKHDDILFNAGKLTDLSELKTLNDVKFSDLKSFEMDFELVPELLYLTKEIEHSRNGALLKKDREFSVPLGDGGYLNGQFKPSWNDKGLTLKCTNVSRETMDDPDIFGLSGGYRASANLTTSLI
jgi:hypothetical protein